jgi:hypothetical protein
MQTASVVARNDDAENDAILDNQCVALAHQLFAHECSFARGGEVMEHSPSCKIAYREIKRLAAQWADGQREVCALIAEEMRYPVVAMAIRGQIEV